MNSTTENPSTEERLKVATAHKTELEAKLLEQQLSPDYRRRETLKMVLSASGLIIALVTLIGGFLSVLKWFDEQSQSRRLREDEQLQRLITLLSEGNQNQQIAATASLRSFISKTEPNRNSQILVSMANVLPVVESGLVRNGINAFFDDLDADAVGTNPMDAALRSLVINNRGIAQGKDVWPQLPDMAHNLKERPALQAVADAIATLLRKGARTNDLSGIYLGRTNLRSLELSGTGFDGSVLTRSDFWGSTLRGASFNDANLENVEFEMADLSNARLRARHLFDEDPNFKESYFQQMERLLKSRGLIRLPNFTCADVRHADFTGRALFTLAQKGVPNLFSARSIFEAANVAEADFAELYFYAAQLSGPAFELPIKSSFGFTRLVGDISTTVYAIDSQADLIDTSSQFSDSLALLGYSWSGSNWRRAKLPKALHELLTQMNMPDTPQPQVRCSPRTPW